MAPKEDVNRLNSLEKAISVHDEGFERLNQQCSDLREGFMAAPPDLHNSEQPARLNLEATSLLGLSPTKEQSKTTTATPFYQKLPRVEFPKFNGTQVRNWLQKTNRFFLLHPMEDQQKVLYASLNFSDVTDSWFQTDASRFAELSWHDFSTLIQHRFSEELSENIIGEFKLLSQKGSILEYQQQYEQLQPLVLLQNPGLTEQYFIDNCIAGLQKDIRHAVQMFYPTSVQSVFALARLQEANLSTRGKYRGNKLYSHSNSVYSNYKPSSSFPPYGLNPVVSKNDDGTGSSDIIAARNNYGQPQGRKLTPVKIQERRCKGLCFNCDETWSVKHKCKAKQLFLIVGDSEDNTELSDTASVPEPSDNSAPMIKSDIAISLNALSGNVSYQTMLLKGKVKNRTLTMLVDTGSTHNFLDANTAKALGCSYSDTPAHQVVVAGGSHLTCDKVSGLLLGNQRRAIQFGCSSSVVRRM
ncbi:hypothetical protein ACHQM5_010889 [Ranunculus cassubicifolius]